MAEGGAAPDLLSLVRAFAAHGGAGAIGVGDDVCTAAALRERVEATAAGMLRAGLAVGDRVAVLLPRSVDEAVSLLAVAAAGAIAVPVHQKLKDEQVSHLLADCAPFAVITNRTRLLPLRDPPALLRDRRVWFTDAAAGVGDAVPVAADGSALSPPAPRCPAVLLYTSGSTGPQKGIVQDHHNLALGAAVVAGYLGLTARDHVLALLPFSFDYGLNQLLSVLHTGARLTAADHLGGGELAWLLRRHRPTGLAGVPSLWHEVAAALAAGTLTEDDGRSLRYVTNSGGVLRRSDGAVLRQRWPQVQVFAMYGLTEAFRSAFLPPGEYDAFPDSFGRALPGVELLLVDGDGKVLEGEATGELVHAGALVAHGYWRRPQDTAARFRPDPRGCPGTVVYSGDIVRRDAGGRHFFVGRNDRLLKVQGHRVSPDEVAGAVSGMAGVGEVWVFGRDGGADGHRLELHLAGDPADRALVEAVLRRCRQQLPSYMQPQRVRVWPQLPHNPNGKIDEAALRRSEDECTGPT